MSDTRLKILVISFTATLAALPAYAQQDDLRDFREWHDMMHGGAWGWGGMVGGLLMMALFWGGLALVVLLAVRWLGGQGGAFSAHPPPRSSLDILKERYARGEIDKAEYEERRRALLE